MNNNQKQGEKAKLAEEKKVLESLKKQYRTAALDVQKKIRIHSGKINALLADWDNLDDNQKSQLQSQIYQKKYQESLAKQLDEIMDNLDTHQYDTVSEYLNGCYESGFLASMYDLHGQGIPIITPIDQKAVAQAVTLDAKISKKLYGGYVDEMKKNIRAEISRGIATNSAFSAMARNLTNATNVGFNKTMRIVRTEGHRIQVEAANDAQHKAKDAGADVLSQWDATLDGRTRESHRRVDGEVRELDEKFSNGLKYPGDSAGGAGEVVNCRCALLQRARWALDDEELQTLKDRAAYFGLDKTDTFEDFKKTYLKSAEKAVKMEAEKISAECQRLLDALKGNGVEYRQAERHSNPLSDSEIITVLSGGDKTRGSCASVGLAYCGQKGGLNVLDFRDGKSREFFSTKWNLREISKLPGMKTHVEVARSSVTAGNKLLKKVENGKEYYLVSGRHAAIVRKTDEGVLQYLELQSATRSGWMDFDGNPRATLNWRFGESKGYDVEDFMIEVDSMKDSDDLRNLLGYINTAEGEQRKGEHGTIK